MWAWPLEVVLFVRGARRERSEHHNAFGIDRERFSSLGVSQPSELHDRPTRGVDDESLDIFGLAFHATALAGQQGDLGYRGHDVEIQGGAGDVTAAGYGGYGLMAPPLMSIVSVGFRESAPLGVGGDRTLRWRPARRVRGS